MMISVLSLPGASVRVTASFGFFATVGIYIHLQDGLTEIKMGTE